MALKILLLIWTTLLISCEVIKIIYSQVYDFHRLGAIPLEFCSGFWLFFIILCIYVYIFNNNKNYQQLVTHVALVLFIVLLLGVICIPHLIYGDWTWSLYYQFKNGVPEGYPIPSTWFWIFYACHSVIFHLVNLLIVGLIVINNRAIIKWKTLYFGIIYFALWDLMVCVMSFTLQFNYMNFNMPFFLPQVIWNQWYCGVIMYFIWLGGGSCVLSFGTLISNRLINKKIHLMSK
ncbi:MAG: hypothetical protein LBJ97_01030 [Mycoplasmataceae bacterium]|nr:hypothetical protein [Mycoplasmataceae bacterium]